MNKKRDGGGNGQLELKQKGKDVIFGEKKRSSLFRA